MCIHTRLDVIRLTEDATKFNINVEWNTVFTNNNIAVNNVNCGKLAIRREIKQQITSVNPLNCKLHANGVKFGTFSGHFTKINTNNTKRSTLFNSEQVETCKRSTNNSLTWKS